MNAEDVTQILCVGRSAVEHASPKVRSLVLADLFDHSVIADELVNFDACFYCLGVSSAGQAEEFYSRITYDLTLSIADVLEPRNPNMTFVYMCAQGSDPTGNSKVMWARVRGRLENSLFERSFKKVYSLRPGYIQPMDGIKSRTALYRVAYDVFGFIYPLLTRLIPDSVTSTRAIGKAMLNLARGYESPAALAPADINRLAKAEEN
ncbi:hypothetical protein [Reinekea marinisedimentorum]|uniref:hypothetical protein n=1 Tax=Reinekea marinisedimentorum TaxID=230495 RepID=UPI001A9DC356|nr:hypothetical protein [Reinekea marinisedimentorum]